MAKSAGILMYRDRPWGREVLLVHPGGPFWKNKDDGAWSIPKGEFNHEEDPLAAARREFEEELGSPVEGEFRALEPIRQKGGKLVHAFAVRGDFDVAGLKSNTFSFRGQSFPEVDRAEWFDLETARRKILPSQLPLLDAVGQVQRLHRQ
jgi:predicted NUDIX family NTP pyrophosphohydrolase